MIKVTNVEPTGNSGELEPVMSVAELIRHAKIHEDIVSAIVSVGCYHQTAVSILSALTSGKIPHVEVVY